MAGTLTDSQRRRALRIIKLGEKNVRYYLAKAAIAQDAGRSPEKVLGILARGLAVDPDGKVDANGQPPVDHFEEDLDYVLDKNAELYRRLAR